MFSHSSHVFLSNTAASALVKVSNDFLKIKSHYQFSGPILGTQSYGSIVPVAQPLTLEMLDSLGFQDSTTSGFSLPHWILLR